MRIVATPEQIRLLKQADEAIELIDDHGKRLGLIAKEEDLQDIRIARERLDSGQLRFSYAAVLEHLQRLETQ